MEKKVFSRLFGDMWLLKIQAMAAVLISLLFRDMWDRRLLKIQAMVAVLILVTALSTGWLIYYKPGFRGRVLDAETGEPIEGAAVVAKYYKNIIISFPTNHVVMMDERETLTDEKGEFRFPTYLTVTPRSVIWYTGFVIFRPGYGNFPDHSASPPSLSGDIEERFFSEDFGTDGEVWVLMKEGGRHVPVTFGVVRLPRAKTWKERRDASSVSIYFTDKCPVTHKMLSKEDEWLSENRKGRR